MNQYQNARTIEGILKVYLFTDQRSRKIDKQWKLLIEIPK